MPIALEKIARRAGVEFRYGAQVQEVCCTNGRVSLVKTQEEHIKTGTVISNASALGTYSNLLQGARLPAGFLRRLRRLPLQSPGVCAYLSVEYKHLSAPTRTRPPYLRFRLSREGLCRLLIQPGTVSDSRSDTARLLAPVSHAWAKKIGPEGQHHYLDGLLQESWWRSDFTRARAVAHLVPREWGDRYHLYDDSMNPVMTSRLMRQGRLPHKSPFVEGLYFAGSATHPGQWVSFCAISGVLAARQVHSQRDKNVQGKRTT